MFILILIFPALATLSGIIDAHHRIAKHPQTTRINTRAGSPNRFSIMKLK